MHPFALPLLSEGAAAGAERSKNPANADFQVKLPAMQSSGGAADWQGSKWQQHLGGAGIRPG